MFKQNKTKKPKLTLVLFELLNDLFRMVIYFLPFYTDLNGKINLLNY